MELLTAQEVAARLRVSISTISRWSKSGVLQPVRVGGTLRFRAEDVDRLIDGEPLAS